MSSITESEPSDTVSAASMVSTGSTNLKGSNNVESKEIAEIGESESKESSASLDASQKPVRPADCAFGWIPTIAVMINNMFIFGASNSYGVFSTYYLNIRFPDTPATTLSWIGTLITMLMLSCNVVTGALADKIGYRMTAYIGTVLCTAAYILASFSDKVWQLILTQGVMLGIGTSFLYAPSVSIPPQWFEKHKGLASGIAIAGTSIGGLWFTAVTQVILDKMGDKWALRILGIITFGGTSLMNMLYFRRVPAKPRKNLFEFSAAKRLTFWLFSLEVFAMHSGFWAITFYIGTTARLFGGSLQDSSNLLLVLNASSAVGRLLAGVVADRFGKINTLLVSIILTVIIEMPLWMTARSLTPLYVLCILYGIVSPAFTSINPVIVATQFDPETLASVIGMSNQFAGIGVLTGNLSQGAIFDKYDKRKKFTNTIIFSGMFILFAGFASLALRTHVIRRVYRQKGTKLTLRNYIFQKI